MTQTLDPQVPARVTRVEQIEGKIDRDAVGKMNVPAGGPQFQNMMEVMEFAKLMAVSDVAVPRHLRGNPGACLAICIQALEWRMWPYAVANKSYVVNDRMSYESQLVHAVVEQRAPLLGRLRCRYTGEGEQRRCIVWARIRGEEEPLEFQSAEFGKIQPKNSPLWKTKPDLQLFYNASRDWARMYFPDVILGVYAEDEIQPIELTGPAATAARSQPLDERVKQARALPNVPESPEAAGGSAASTEPAAGDPTPPSAPVSGTESVNKGTGEVTTTEEDEPTLEDLATWGNLTSWAVEYYVENHRVEKTTAMKGLDLWVSRHLRAKTPKDGSKLRGDLAVAILEGRLDLATGEVGE